MKMPVTHPFVYRSRLLENVRILPDYHVESEAFFRRARHLVGRLFPGEGRKPLVLAHSTGTEFVGVTATTWHETPPDGWKKHTERGTFYGWSPKVSTKAGKALRARFDKVAVPPHPRTLMVGMPGQMFTGLSFPTCGMENLTDDEGEALYVTWPGELEGSERGVDLTEGGWELVALSTYHTIREQAPEPETGMPS